MKYYDVKIPDGPDYDYQYNLDELRTAYEQGRLGSSHIVRQDGTKAWLPIRVALGYDAPAIDLTTPNPETSLAEPGDCDLPLGLPLPLAFGAVGAALGLLVSYMFRPSLFGMTPSMTEWFTRSEINGWTSTIVICGIVGLALGAGFGLLMARKPS